MKENKILFVEDDLEEDPVDSAIWTELKEAGYEVTPARTGMEALGKLQSEEFHLILLDIMLPPKLKGDSTPVASELASTKRLDMGLRLLDLLRSRAFEPDGTPADVAVVVVSAVPGVARWGKIRDLVGQPGWCLDKPREPDEILQVVKQALPLMVKAREL